MDSDSSHVICKYTVGLTGETQHARRPAAFLQRLHQPDALGGLTGAVHPLEDDQRAPLARHGSEFDIKVKQSTSDLIT